MFVKEAPLFGANCRIVWGTGKSSISVSLTPSETDSTGPLAFGVLAYALPYRDSKTTASVLISSENQMAVDSATQVSQMLAALFHKPVFVNTSIANMDPFLLSNIKEFATEQLDHHPTVQA